MKSKTVNCIPEVEPVDSYEALSKAPDLTAFFEPFLWVSQELPNSERDNVS